MDAWRATLESMPTVGEADPPDELEVVAKADSGFTPAQQTRQQDRIESESEADGHKQAEMLHRGRMVATYQPEAPVASLAAVARNRREMVRKNRQVQRRGGSGLFNDLPHPGVWKAQPITGEVDSGPKAHHRPTVNAGPTHGTVVTG